VSGHLWFNRGAGDGCVGRRERDAEFRRIRLKKLAGRIQELTAKDSDLLQKSLEILAVRREAAVGLHRMCAALVNDLNPLLPQQEVILDPLEFSEADFRDASANWIQINIRGRILRISFQATEELTSTEDFRVPYCLEGVVRGFHQQRLEKDLIEEQLLFYTVEKDQRMWRYFDPRTYRSGPFNEEHLFSLLDQMI